METKFCKSTSLNIIGYTFSKLKMAHISKYVLLCLLSISLPSFSYAQEDYEKITEKKAQLEFNLKQIENEKKIAILLEDDRKYNMIESGKAYMELMEFRKLYPDRYFTELGPEKTIHAQQIEADFKTKHRAEIYKWDNIKIIERKYNDIIFQWVSVGNALQKKSDLIPNLISATKCDVNFWDYEKSSFSKMIEIRAKITSSDIFSKSFKSLNDSSLKTYQDLVNSFDIAFENFLEVTNKYPILQKNNDFQNWKSQFIENKKNIVTEERKYNEMIYSYKNLINQLCPELNLPIKPQFKIN